MPRAKISDAYGITVELEASEASVDVLGKQALELLAAAVAIVDKRPVGPGGYVQAERRPEDSFGFGIRPSQAPVPYQHHEIGGE